jgi:serine/threonine protein kinase
MTGQETGVTTADTPSTRGRRPETFGRYELLGLLGQGGMGRLYVAERRGIQGFVKVVALKQILPHLAESASLREMFLNEARVAAKLQHPNIVATYELGEVDGQYFISMEYLPGEDFATIGARCQGDRRVPVEVAAALAQQAATGLHHAHEARDEQGRFLGLVHRDVNPRNLFLTYHGVVKVLDFGVVRGAEGRGTAPGAFKGKYGYCAPEQLEGGAVDRRTDVFCLGIVLWECLTGARLFEASTDAATIDAVRSGAVAPPSLLRPEIPPALDEIVLRALAREPERRFQSAHDLSEALDAFLLERDMRPTSKSVGRWLESMFGADRASLKKAISHGASVEEALDRLATLEAAVTERGMTTLGAAAGAARTPPPGSHAGATRGRAFGPIAMVGAAAALGIVALLVARRPLPGDGAAQPAHEARATVSLVVKSDPPGAHIFVDGSPSGFKTPATLAGLTVGERVTLRLDKEGYEPVTKHLELTAGEASLSLTLRSARGTLRLEGAPRRATIFLDDLAVGGAGPITAAAGEHRLRVEVDQAVLVSKTVEVRAQAETVVDLGPGKERSAP